MTSNSYRREQDTLGEILVPKDAYYGAQTQRAINNFQISNRRFPHEFIKVQAMIKAAAAKANMENELLAKSIGNAIIGASEEVMEGKWDHQFVLDVYQAGAGTSQNMNANEVIANRATELLDDAEKHGRIHPNDHVNMSQSTNDTFHAVIHITAAVIINQKLLPRVKQLHDELKRKSIELMPVMKSGRTHLHDAIPIRMGQEFSGYAETIHEVYQQLERVTDSLYEIGIGGTAIGTRNNIHPDYSKKVIQEISRRTNLPFREPTDMFSYMQNTNAPIRVMQVIKELSIHLIKITSDLRLLASGPRTGLTEISLPGVQPGSTIMPGKVNPAILEMTHMVCCQVIGYETTIATAGVAGQLEINVMMPLIAHTFIESLEIMSNALPTLVTKCISGITANEENCKNFMENSLALVTGISSIVGYDMAAQIGKEADSRNVPIKQVLQERELLTPEIEKALDPNGMV
ncbi:class II fumarate hydratase [Oceanobacillus bengalensis]|uniref:Aspartate ammonia-lyase n=1 Tax=Oceanobacillus bengalensis TaxID=1435466 RepID=A0A494Z3W0_9BACI|nr:aspartate ammonia-lyase [Oceanobacillus bengalensis]RKQ17131.1 aspartate ammonia-lyase [Oceanobacillus bengalensis]